jgi:hypothetical protein
MKTGSAHGRMRFSNLSRGLTLIPRLSLYKAQKWAPVRAAQPLNQTPPAAHTQGNICKQGFRILMRDGFRRKACGASPLSKPGTELHVDHVVPWSKGNDTVDDNLESKCQQYNLGKGTAFIA